MNVVFDSADQKRRTFQRFGNTTKLRMQQIARDSVA
jgi:hypothetical protein